MSSSQLKPNRVNPSPTGSVCVCVCVCVCLTLRAHYLHVEVGEAAGCGQGQFDHALHGDGVAVQVVEQGAVFVVV